MELNNEEVELITEFRQLSLEWKDHILMLLQVALTLPDPPK
jgi:hypothetical protein